MADEFNQQYGAPQNQVPPQQVQYQQPQQMPPVQYQQPPVKQKKPIFKKWWFWVIIVIVLIVVIGSIGGGKDDSSDTATTSASISADGSEAPAATDGTIGDYVCVVKGASITQDYDGAPAVKITYEFTNNAAEAESFDLALIDHVFQGGIELEHAYLADDNETTYDVQIKPGVTMEVNKVYVLRDSTTPLEVEISEFISFSDDKLTTTVELVNE